MNQKLHGNRKGVSTVISTILMIMVVMVGMSVLFGALIVYSDNFQKGSGSAVLESITIEDVQFTPNSHVVKLTLYNTGKTDLIIANVYINGQITTLQPTPPATTTSIAQGEHLDRLSVTTPSEITFTPGTSYNFKIVTQRGTGFEGMYVC